MLDRRLWERKIGRVRYGSCPQEALCPESQFRVILDVRCTFDVVFAAGLFPAAVDDVDLRAAEDGPAVAPVVFLPLGDGAIVR